jgi:solute carrier family 25 phosphate transporter 3
VSHAIATPLDVIKTRQQAAPQLYIGHDGEPLGVVATGARIARQEGPKMLLKGMGATCSGYLVQGAFKFGLWESFKTSFGYSAAVGCHKIGVLILAAFLADIVASLLLCPFERARIRMVSNPQFASDVLSAMARMVREEGLIEGLYGGGLAATMLKQQSYTIAKFTSFTLIQEALSGMMSVAPRALLTLASSAAAGFVASVASQPGDTLQVGLSTSSSKKPCQGSLLSAARSIGLKNLFAGWKARLVQIEVIVISQLLLYDYVKMLVGL